MATANVAMTERWKGFMLKGVDQMLKYAPVEINKVAELKALIETLPIELESWDKETDTPYQEFFQKELNFRVDFMSKLIGVNAKFYKGAFEVYRYALSLVREIAADDELQAIAVKLAAICDAVKVAVTDQNQTNDWLKMYDRRLADLE
jgi:hypothetical protein